MAGRDVSNWLKVIQQGGDRGERNLDLLISPCLFSPQDATSFLLNWCQLTSSQIEIESPFTERAAGLVNNRGREIQKIHPIIYIK